jgi:hypothetical protein
MKIKVCDILRAKESMIINVDPDDQDEKVSKGDYFIVIDYGEYKWEDETYVGWTLLSQKSISKSRWSKEDCSPMSDHFCNE